jgi:outer membrane protein assembly factor BamB
LAKSLAKSIPHSLGPLFLIILTFLCTLWIEAPVEADFSTDNWPMFNHDLAHTGCSTSSAPRINQTLWAFTAGDAVKTSPAVVDGIVYFGSDDCYVYALNAANGSLVWKYNTYGPVQSSPAVVDDVVYIGGYHGHAVFALNAYTGDLIWQSPTDSGYPNSISATAVANGLVYVTVASTSDCNGRLVAFNASTGKLTWQKIIPGWTWASPAIYEGRVYIGSSTGDIAALNATSRDQLWSITDLGYDGHSSFSIGDDLVYISKWPQGLQAWNASSGAFVWACSTKGNVVYATPAIANGVVYVSTGIGGAVGNIQRGGVTAIDAKSGALLWNHTIGSIQHSSPAVAGGMVFVGSDEISIMDHTIAGAHAGHTVYALDSTTGELRWTYLTGGEVYSSPAVAHGIVYVGSNDGKVYAIGSKPQIPSPTPAVPEFYPWIALLVVTAASLSLVAFKNRQRKLVD